MRERAQNREGLREAACYSGPVKDVNRPPSLLFLSL